MDDYTAHRATCQRSLRRGTCIKEGDKAANRPQSSGYRSAADISIAMSINGNTSVAVVVSDPADASGKVHVDLEQLYPETSWANRLQQAIKDHPIFMLSKSTCPFCIEAEKVFKDAGVQVHTVETDLIDNGGALRKASTELTNLKTVPSIWIDGVHIGGCYDLKTLQTKGELNILIASAVRGKDVKHNASVGQGSSEAPKPLLWFPETVNTYVIRLVALFAVILGIISVIFREDTWAHWMLAGLFADFVVRFAYASTLSPLGLLATLCVANVRPKLSAGPPKQFAAFVGTMFTAASVACSFNGATTASAVIMSGLVVAAALEAFLGFCLGCWFFGLMIKLGIVSPHVYTLHLNMRDNTLYKWEEQFIRVETQPVKKIGYEKDAKEDAMRYKVKRDENERQDFHLIRHHDARQFMWPLSIGGLALAWRLAAESTTLSVDETVWKVIGYIGGATFGALLLMYICKAVLYPRKIKKEWMHPVMGNTFGVISLCFIVYSSLINTSEYRTYAKILFWIGAPAHLVLTVVRAAEFIGRRVSQEHVNAAWMIFPVGNLVAAMVAPDLDADYEEVAVLWFGPAIFLWLVLFPITFHHAITTHNSITKQRGLYFIWVAAPAAASLAYLRLAGAPDLFSKSLLWLSAILLLILLWTILPYMYFFTCEPFHMSYWVYPFCINILTVAFVAYDMQLQTSLTNVLAVVMLSTASWVVLVALLHTLIGLARRHIFRPEPKWGPISFMNLTHEAIRPALDDIEKLVQDVQMNGVGTPSFHALIEEMKTMQMIHEEHSAHEDKVVFTTFEEIFPEIASVFHSDHEEDHTIIPEINKDLQSLDEKSTPDDIRGVCQRIKEFADKHREHLRGEEDHMSPIGRKYLNMDMMTQIVRRVWDITPVERWRVYLPWVVNHLPKDIQRARFLKTFMWAMPERAQQIGRYVYEGVDAAEWRNLTTKVPEIIPRGVNGWYRYY